MRSVHGWSRNFTLTHFGLLPNTRGESFLRPVHFIIWVDPCSWLWSGGCAWSWCVISRPESVNCPPMRDPFCQSNCGNTCWCASIVSPSFSPDPDPPQEGQCCREWPRPAADFSWVRDKLKCLAIEMFCLQSKPSLTETTEEVLWGAVCKALLIAGSRSRKNF